MNGELKVELKGAAGKWTDNSGATWYLESNTRPAAGKSRPDYVLWKRDGKGKRVFVSGVWRTPSPTAFAFDLKDNIGVKHYHALRVTADGAAIFPADKQAALKGVAGGANT
jgi:hypothetical protein